MMYSATMSDEMRTILHKFTTRVRTLSSFSNSLQCCKLNCRSFSMTPSAAGILDLLPGPV